MILKMATLNIMLFCALFCFLDAGRAHCAGLPLGLAWDEPPARVEALLKKRATNVRMLKEGWIRPHQKVIAARKYYDDHPFTVRCGFSEDRLREIGFYAFTAGFANNLARAADLAQKVFISKLLKMPDCALVKREDEAGDRKLVYKTAHAYVEITYGPYPQSGAARLYVTWLPLEGREDPFLDKYMYFAELLGNRPD